jgi:hypothetical protein
VYIVVIESDKIYDPSTIKKIAISDETLISFRENKAEI